ncbi:hypothetical protein HaLaN_04320 [Haematococcus lacustris]|uniref:Uncharacterized protein n=1 Tax=Haematococcus lacustris TaxID=44745 RepID=A0A699YGG3_HAELA|nr:hypothetical protein HaLaN_04320 [Haematococcus lacustris]
MDEDPVMLRQLKNFSQFFANPIFLTVYNQLQRRLVRPRQHRHPMLMPVFEDLSNQALLAKLQELGSINLNGDANTIGAVTIGAELAVSMRQHFINPGKARLGWSGVEAQLYGINAQCSELQAATLDKGHVADLIEEADKHRRLLGMKKQGSQRSLERSGQLVADQLARWKLTKGQVKHAGGLNNAHRDTERWLAPIKPHLQHLAAASSAGTSLEVNLKHITVTLATWDAVWEVYLDRKPRGSDQLRGRVVLVDEHRTTGVSSAVNGQQPCEEELDQEQPTSRAGWEPPAGQASCISQEATQPAASEPGPSTPPPAKRSKRTKAELAAEPTKGTGKGKGKAAKAKPAPQSGRGQAIV